MSKHASESCRQPSAEAGLRNQESPGRRPVPPAGQPGPHARRFPHTTEARRLRKRPPSPTMAGSRRTRARAAPAGARSAARRAGSSGGQARLPPRSARSVHDGGGGARIKRARAARIIARSTSPHVRAGERRARVRATCSARAPGARPPCMRAGVCHWGTPPCAARLARSAIRVRPADSRPQRKSARTWRATFRLNSGPDRRLGGGRC